MSAATFPVLTILYHPQLRRVGERCVLTQLEAGKAVAISRSEPQFTAVGRTRSEALSDRNISRQPFILESDDQGEGAVRLRFEESRTKVVADGEVIADDYIFSAADVERGVVLDLSERVVVLLHRGEAFSELLNAQGLVGESCVFRHLWEELVRASKSQAPVFLRGEAGCLGDRLGYAIHREARRVGKYEAIHLDQLDEEDMESVIFGGTRGRPGAIFSAEHGTLYLAKIEKASRDVQTLLLRVLESGELRTGGRPQPVDTQLIIASAAEESDPAFQRPLLRGLKDDAVQVPPLRVRRDDLGRLILDFLRLELQSSGESKRLEATDATAWFPAATMARLAQHDWPGNEVQLRDVVRRLVDAARSGEELQIPADVEDLL